MKNTAEKYTVSLFGDTYTLMSDEGSAAVAVLAQRVDTLMQEISLKTACTDSRRVAILALVKVCHQLHTLETQLQQRNHEESQLVNYIEQQMSALLVQ
jgi:cell division protein ZapA (FtsZ GTPase activity inhibitor)